MPFPQETYDAIYETTQMVQRNITDISRAIGTVFTILHVNAEDELANTESLSVINAYKAKAKDAAQAVVDLLT